MSTRLDKQPEDFFRIQQYVGDYKVWFNGKMYFISNDGVSKHASEKAFYKTVEDGTMGYYYNHRKIPKDLKEELGGVQMRSDNITLKKWMLETQKVLRSIKSEYVVE